MGTRKTPPPRSLIPETGEIDDSWDELVGDAFRGPKIPEDVDSDVFDRPTAVPDVPPSGLELDFGSAPPRSLPTAPRVGLPKSDAPEDAHEAVIPGPRFPMRGLPTDSMPTVTPDQRHLRAQPGFDPDDARAAPQMPLPGRRPHDEPTARRKQTMPEPIVERYLQRVEAGSPSPVDALANRNAPDPMEAVLETASPLELVETYRKSVDNFPAQRPDAPQPDDRGGRENSSPRQDMQDRYAVGDFTGALVVAESLLDADPENEDAKRYAQSCREVLTQMYAARIGPMDQVATVAVPPDQITWLSLDHRAGFLLSLVDGVSTIEEILDISGMSRLDALRIMYTLVQQNVVTLAQ
ncbi:MAG TPA: hypothetical protein VHE30_26690 [Polyangiaceae bacterium]|nr:hypothetical protein [Polyangiaceae bacterium]